MVSSSSPVGFVVSLFVSVSLSVTVEFGVGLGLVCFRGRMSCRVILESRTEEGRGVRDDVRDMDPQSPFLHSLFPPRGEGLPGFSFPQKWVCPQVKTKIDRGPLN